MRNCYKRMDRFWFLVHRVFLGLAFLLLEVLDSDEPNPVPAVKFPFPPPLSGCLKQDHAT